MSKYNDENEIQSLLMKKIIICFNIFTVNILPPNLPRIDPISIPSRRETAEGFFFFSIKPDESVFLSFKGGTVQFCGEKKNAHLVDDGKQSITIVYRSATNRLYNVYIGCESPLKLALFIMIAIAYKL